MSDLNFLNIAESSNYHNGFDDIEYKADSLLKRICQLAVDVNDGIWVNESNVEWLLNSYVSMLFDSNYHEGSIQHVLAERRYFRSFLIIYIDMAIRKCIDFKINTNHLIRNYFYYCGKTLINPVLAIKKNLETDIFKSENERDYTNTEWEEKLELVERQAEFWGGREERSMLGLLIESSRRIPKLGFLKFLDYGYQNINDDVCAVFNKRLWEAVRTSDISNELGFDINEDAVLIRNHLDVDLILMDIESDKSDDDMDVEYYNPEDDPMYQAFEILEQSESTEDCIGINKNVSVSDLNVEHILEPKLLSDLDLEPDLSPEF